MRWRGPAVLGALWMAAASLAVTVGLVAVHLVAGEVGDTVSSPLSDGKVQQALASLTPSPNPPSPSVTPTSRQPSATSTPQVRGALRTVHTTGGAVGARCEDDEPDLVYSSPAEAWRTDRSTDELVRFVSSTQSIEVRLSCSDNELQTRVRTEDVDKSPAPSPSPSEHEDSHSPEPSKSPDPDESEESHSDD